MKILIVAATNRDVSLLKKHLSLHRNVDKQFTRYKYGKLRVDILITGVGPVFTTYQLTKILSFNHYDLALNIGAAGSFDHFFEVGFVVNVIQDCFADVGFEDNEEFYTLCEKEFLGSDEFPFNSCVLKNNSSFTLSEIETLIPVKGITVNTLKNGYKAIDKLNKKFKPEVLTMEGAAFFYCCLLEQVPFFQIRVIANYIDIQNIENWQIPDALKNLTSSVIAIFDQMESLV